MALLPRVIRHHALLGKAQPEPEPAPIPGAVWYTARAIEDGLTYAFPRGALAKARYLTADLLLDGDLLAIFLIRLAEGKQGRVFELNFGALAQCQARIRFPLDLVDQNRWGIEREGSWLKPRCAGQIVDLAKVDRMTFTVQRMGPMPVRWCLTDFTATAAEPPRLTKPLLPQGPLLDELGQSALRNWPEKTRSVAVLTGRLHAQAAAAPARRWPKSFSRWGGCADLRFAASGFFRTHHDGRRWWLVDPDGYAFWSAGMDCVRVDCNGMCQDLTPALSWRPARDGAYKAIYSDQRRLRRQFVNYLAANCIRAFGPKTWHDQWARIALSWLRDFGFNTVANWSEWQIARAAGFPYVRPLSPVFPKTPLIFREFPDVFDPAFATDATRYAQQLAETRDDPALIGYFLMNEPTWGFASMLPAEGMLTTAPACAARQALAEHLRRQYRTGKALAKAWGCGVTFADFAEGTWQHSFTAAARRDLEAFSTIMVERFFRPLNDACRKVDANHLNLGARYFTVPPRWAFEGMRGFDVFSVNGYGERVRAELGPYSAEIGQPVMIGEWHFGALDAGLPASGIGHVKDQAARGQAYRVYLEDAAVKPWCVGVHWFTLYDESALGRFDGENWNIGFLDICNRPYAPLAKAARLSHQRLYALARGTAEPYATEPERLPWLFS